MELRLYWKIFTRRWWVAVGLAALVMVISLAVGVRLHAAYTATTRVVVSVAPEPPKGAYFTYDKYYAFLSTEYLVDDLSEFVKSRVFAEAIRDELGDPSLDVNAIQQSQRPKKTHRVLAVTVTTSDPRQTERIAAAAGRVLEKKAADYLIQLNAEEVSIKVIDPPSVEPSGGGWRSLLELGLRAALGFVAGLGLILLAEYLDTSVRDAEEAERLLGVPVLGEIPKGG